MPYYGAGGLSRIAVDLLPQFAPVAPPPSSPPLLPPPPPHAPFNLVAVLCLGSTEAQGKANALTWTTAIGVVLGVAWLWGMVWLVGLMRARRTLALEIAPRA